MKRTLIAIALLALLVPAGLLAQTPQPTATPTAAATTVAATTAEPTAEPTATPVPIMAADRFAARQAVVKQPIDGDSVEVVFTDNGQIATVHLMDVKAPSAMQELECFGRESAEYAAQAYKDSPLITIEPAGEIKDDQVRGYVTLGDGTLLNEMLVLFGYARFEGKDSGAHSERIRAAEEQSKKGRSGLWRTCGDAEEPAKPCFLFADRELDSKSKRMFLTDYPEAHDMSVSFNNVHYDPVQHEIIVLWDLNVRIWSGGWRLREYYRLSDCLADRIEVYNVYDQD